MEERSKQQIDELTKIIEKNDVQIAELKTKQQRSEQEVALNNDDMRFQLQMDQLVRMHAEETEKLVSKHEDHITAMAVQMDNECAKLKQEYELKVE